MTAARVGFDCVALPARFSGGANYIVQLARHILLQANRPPIAIFCKDQHSHLFRPLLTSTDNLVEVRIANPIHKLAFYEYQLPPLLKRYGVGLFHATFFLCPPRDPRYKIVTNFHDIGLLTHPTLYTYPRRLYFGSRMTTFLSRSDRILAPSQSTADSISHTYPELTSKIVTLYPGVDRFPVCTRDKHPRSIVLAVNTLEKRKNVPFLIEVFGELCRRFNIEHQFIIVGHPANGYRSVISAKERSPYRDRISIQTSISDDQLLKYYNSAQFFLNASCFEGFGFTPFEALHLNCPVFLYENPIVRELLGSHQHIFCNLDPVSWAEVIGPELVRGFGNCIQPEKIRLLTWETTAREALAIYESVLKEEKNPLAQRIDLQNDRIRAPLPLRIDTLSKAPGDPPN